MTVRKLPALLFASLMLVTVAADAISQGRGGGPPLTLPGVGPAAVPPAVAMPRPSPAEIEAAQRALTRFVESADPAVRATLQKNPDLVAVRPPRANTAIMPSLGQGFLAKHQANLEVAKLGDANVLFMGDSITDFWRNADGQFAGKPVLDKYFGQWKVANFGIAGDTTQGVLYRLMNGEGKGFNPRAVMLMIGTNNTGEHGPRDRRRHRSDRAPAAARLPQREDSAARRLSARAHRERAGARNDRRDQPDDLQAARRHPRALPRYRRGFLDADGNIPQDVMSDALHPSGKGYEIWANAVIEPLSALMGTPAAAAAR